MAKEVEFSVEDLAKIAGLGDAWSKKPSKVIFADKQQVRLKLQYKQNALYVYMKKPRAEPRTPLHHAFVSLATPELKALTNVYDGELQYCHESRPGEILRLPMEVMLDPFNINWALDLPLSVDAKTPDLTTTDNASTSSATDNVPNPSVGKASNPSVGKNPDPDMTRELVVLYVNNIRSEPIAVNSTTPSGDQITVYHTTLNKSDGTQERIVSASIKPSMASKVPN